MRTKGLRINEDGEGIKLNSLRHLMSALISKKKLRGKEHWVIPTVLMAEGVHNGWLYPGKELQKYPEAWNGRPVVIQHPKKDGKPTSAGSPEILETTTVGTIFNAKWNSRKKKLMAEAWVDPDKAEEVSPLFVKMLNANKPIEVSTGLFTDDEEEAGVWNNEKYDGTCSNYRPDHLAILPGGEGACSWADGAGMPRINGKDEDIIPNEEETDEMRTNQKQKFHEAVGGLMEQADELGLVLRVNELGFSDIRSRLSSLIQPKSTPGKPGAYAYVEDVFDKYFIWNTDGKYYKQGYSIDAQDEVALVGEKVEVERRTSFIPVPSPKTNGSESTETAGGPDAERENLISHSNSKQTKGDSTVERKTIVDALIKSGRCQEADRESLMKMNEADLVGKIEAVPVAAPAPRVNEEKPVVVAPKSAQEVVDAAPEAFRPILQEGIKVHEDKKTAAIAVIKANKANKFTDDQLKSKGLNELEMLASLAKGEEEAPAPDYSGKAPGTTPALKDNENEAPVMPPVFEKKN